MDTISTHDDEATRARLGRVAEDALGWMRSAGFEHAQVTASRLARDEVNISHNEASLMRSTEAGKLALLGIVGGRRASAELAELDDAVAVRARIEALFAGAASAPVDDANAVSSGQQASIEKGPLHADADAIAGAVEHLLAHRARHTPKMMLDEAFVAHERLDACTLTSGGSALACRLGTYEISAFGTARDGRRSSSFAMAGGHCDELSGRPPAERFGIAEMLESTERQIDASPYGARFTGDVVLAPQAVTDLVGWLLGQLDDTALIAGTSLYLGSVGTRIAAPLLSLRSRFDAPGCAPFSADAFVAPPVEVLTDGVLQTLLPSLYGSRKTGLRHVPTGPSGWELAAGPTERSDLVASVTRGALVGRLSMGRPAANGDFSGVIKNSFRIESGQVGQALAETMISGNVARMLEAVAGASRERLDEGAWLLPWLLVTGLHFS